MRVGKKIQTIRKEQGLTQKELGGLLGVSGSMIGQYENDLRNPKFETLLRIAEVLSVSPEYLMGHEISDEKNQHFSIVEKICNLRKQNRLSQEQMAELLGINRATLSKYETGVIVPSLAQLRKIAEILNVSVVELFPDELANDFDYPAEKGKKALKTSANYLIPDECLFTIGERIRAIRKEKGMTQKQVADKCGMADSAIRKYESGTVQTRDVTLEKIASALGVSSRFLRGASTELIYETVKIIDMAISSLEFHKRQLLVQWSESKKRII